MNKRIRELAEQAEEYAAQNATGDWEVGPAYQDIFNKKFAQLIVRECIETLRLVPYNSDREFGDEVIYQDAVKKHFGVEE